MKLKLVSAVTAWEKVAERHRKVGASDTEPHSVFQWMLYYTVKNLPCRMPRTPDDWQLYDLPNTAEAAVELTKALADCMEIILADPADSTLLVAQKYCWRVQWEEEFKPKLATIKPLTLDSIRSAFRKHYDQEFLDYIADWLYKNQGRLNIKGCAADIQDAAVCLLNAIGAKA